MLFLPLSTMACLGARGRQGLLEKTRLTYALFSYIRKQNRTNLVYVLYYFNEYC